MGSEGDSATAIQTPKKSNRVLLSLYPTIYIRDLAGLSLKQLHLKWICSYCEFMEVELGFFFWSGRRGATDSETDRN